MILRNLVFFTVASLVLLVAACGGPAEQTGTPQVVPTGTIPDAATRTGAPEPTATPSENGGNMNLEVVDFHVWQDFMPGLREGGPPLHATDLLRAEGLAGIRAGIAAGTITISRPGGESVVRSPITLVEALTVPESGAEGKMELQLAMAATPVSIELTENEPLAGKLDLTLGGSNATLDLPSTPLMFTH